MEKKRPIWLRREGDHIVVLVEEVKGEWKEIIREYDPDGKTPFSHIWENNS